MVDPGIMKSLAVALAASSGCAFVCALFFPYLIKTSLASRRSAVFEALLHNKGVLQDAPAATRNIRRAQEIALQSVTRTAANKRHSHLQGQLRAAGLGCSTYNFMLYSLGLGLLLIGLAQLLQMPLSFSFSAAAAGSYYLPQYYLRNLAQRRKQRFLNAFAASVDMIIRGTKSGLSITECLAAVANEADEPVRREFVLLADQLRAGVPLPNAMEKLASAMPAPEIRFFTLIMSMQSQTGGNLTDALSNLAKVLRDRHKLASKVRIASAEARASAITIGSLPFIVIAATAVFAPDYISRLWIEESGRVIIGICASWLILGVLVLRRMARIEA